MHRKVRPYEIYDEIRDKYIESNQPSTLHTHPNRNKTRNENNNGPRPSSKLSPPKTINRLAKPQAPPPQSQIALIIY